MQCLCVCVWVYRVRARKVGGYHSERGGGPILDTGEGFVNSAGGLAQTESQWQKRTFGHLVAGSTASAAFALYVREQTDP